MTFALSHEMHSACTSQNPGDAVGTNGDLNETKLLQIVYKAIRFEMTIIIAFISTCPKRTKLPQKT